MKGSLVVLAVSVFGWSLPGPGASQEKRHPIPIAGSFRQITWILGSRDVSVHAFREQIEVLHEKPGRFRWHSFYDQVEEAAQAEDYYPGIVNPGPIKEPALQAGVDYYNCGPAPFIKSSFRT